MVAEARMHLLWTILVGFIIGLIARALKPGRDAVGFIATSIIGVCGALLAKLIGTQLGWYHDGDRAGLLASVGGAVILLFLYEAVLRWRAKQEQPAK
jgi:uncharacterized membrane protein YeaQ/YmgE (transglycosylase-associated protein family)